MGYRLSSYIPPYWVILDGRGDRSSLGRFDVKNRSDVSRQDFAHPAPLLRAVLVLVCLTTDAGGP